MANRNLRVSATVTPQPRIYSTERILNPMKKLFLLALLPFAMACEKPNVSPVDPHAGLSHGKYQLIEQLISPGGPAVFEPVVSEKTLEFFANGTVESNGNLCQMTTEANDPTFGTWSQQDRMLVPDDCAFPGFSMGLMVENGDVIVAYPCIEPCWQKFRRVAD